MIVTHEREKLLAAMVFFCQKTRHCHTLKLFKLLNFLDFEHYRQAGRTVTGLDYAAFERGPVPRRLWQEMSDGPAKDMRDALSIVAMKDEVTDQVVRRDIKARSPFNSSLFTRRELAIMERLAEVFRDVRGDDMSEFSHMKGLPWRKVWDKGAGRGRRIEPELALDAPPIDYDTPTIERDEITLREDLRKLA